MLDYQEAYLGSVNSNKNVVLLCKVCSGVSCVAYKLPCDSMSDASRILLQNSIFSASHSYIAGLISTCIIGPGLVVKPGLQPNAVVTVEAVSFRFF